MAVSFPEFLGSLCRARLAAARQTTKFNNLHSKFMATKKNKKQETSNEQKWGIGIGVTTAVAAMAGAYFLYGSKDAERNRKKVKSWMLKAKAEVLEGIERAQDMTKEEYEELVNTIGAAYADLQDASKKDIREFKDEMKSHWENIAKHAKQAPRKVTKAADKTKKQATKTAKKAAKKVTKTASKAKKEVAKKSKTSSKK